jgi:hypothetical protein
LFRLGRAFGDLQRGGERVRWQVPSTERVFSLFSHSVAVFVATFAQKRHDRQEANRSGDVSDAGWERGKPGDEMDANAVMIQSSDRPFTDLSYLGQ